MPSRIITTIGLTQLVFVFAILAASRIATRFAIEVFGGRPWPLSVQLTDRFGLYLLLVPILWTMMAASLSRRQALTWGSFGVLVGVAIVLGLILALASTLLGGLCLPVGPLPAE